MKIEKLVGEIGKIEDSKDLDKIIEAAQRRQTYLESDDLGKLCMDLMENVGFTSVLILRVFTMKGNKFVSDSSGDLLGPGTERMVPELEEPINQYIKDRPEYIDLWALIQKVYEDTRMAEDLEFLNSGDSVDSDSAVSVIYIDDADGQLYYELVGWNGPFY